MPKLTTEERFWAKINKTADCWVWTKSLSKGGYGYFYFGGRLDYAHRYSHLIHHGNIPVGMRVDHTCHNHACVNPVHLRVVTNKQNLENRSGLDKNNTSGLRGVCFHKTNRKWVAYVTSGGKRHHLGSYATREEADKAALAGRNALFTHNDLDRLVAR